METDFNKFNISDKTDMVNIKNCNKLFIKELWCKECDPFRIMEGWTG
jgi:hypothetical protein